MREVRQKQLVKMFCVGVVLLLVLYLVRVVLLPLLLAAVLGYVVLPVAERLEGWRLPKGMAAAVSLAVFFCVVGLALMWGLPRLVQDFAALGNIAPLAGLILDEVSHTWQGMKSEVKLTGSLTGTLLECAMVRIGEILGRILEDTLAALPGLLGGVSLVIFTPIFAFYLLRDREKLMEMLPRGIRPLVVDLNHIMQSFVRGYLLVAAVVGLLFGGLLWLFGLQYSFTLGLVMLLAELVPYLGPFLAFFPCLALGLVQGRLAVIKMLLIWLAVQQLENLLITPYIMSGAMRLSPFYIMLAVLIGGFWWGVFGMILAVPLAAGLKVIMNAYVQWYNMDEGIRPEDFV